MLEDSGFWELLEEFLNSFLDKFKFRGGKVL